METAKFIEQIRALSKEADRLRDLSNELGVNHLVKKAVYEQLNDQAVGLDDLASDLEAVKS